ncbi:MAG: PucR family transcriptional regulator [Anaerolineae bacterium]
MISSADVLTIADICREALPLGVEIHATGQGMARAVRWAITSASLDQPFQGEVVLPYLEGGEIVLVPPTKATQALIALVERCAAAQAAAIILIQAVDPLVSAAAELCGLPLLVLPSDSRLREVERSIVSLLLDRAGHTERRSTQIYEQLLGLISENLGMEKIVQSLGRFLSKSVIVQDKHLRVKYTSVAPDAAEHWDAILDLLKDRRRLPEKIADRHKLMRYSSTVYAHALRDDVNRMVVPIMTSGVGRGYLSVIAVGTPPPPFEELDRLVVQHGATICALEMSRQKALSDLEKKLRGDFLNNLMSNAITEAEAQAEGDRFGHDMNAPHVAMVLAWYAEKRPSQRRLETLVNTVIDALNVRQHILQYQRTDELRLFFSTEGRDVVAAARTFADKIIEQLRREYGSEAHLAVGIGSVAARIWDWQTSYRDAAHAAEIARRIRSETPLYVGDLGIYTLLARSEFQEDLRALRDKMIGNLLKYEEKQGADLLQTLEAFFKCHGNYTQTAELLSVHRNTLFYRMNRIQEITGLNLDQPDVRLAVHLSLKIHRLLDD